MLDSAQAQIDSVNELAKKKKEIQELIENDIIQRISSVS